MNALFVIHTPKNRYSAVYNSYHEIAIFLEEQGHMATILAPEDFPSLGRWHPRMFPLFYPFWVASWLIRRGWQYDLASFHSYAGWVVNLLRRWVPAYRRLRTITAFHGLEPLYYCALKKELERASQSPRLRFRLVHGVLMPRLIRLSCRRSDRILSLNREEAAYLARNNWAPNSRISVVPHGVSSEFFIRRQYPDKVRRLLFVGQWIERKGVRYLVDTFTALTPESPNLELWCVGTIVEEEKVLASFNDEVRSQVMVRPQVEQKELITIYRDADLFIFPSLFEGFSVALLEAMAMALPIVATHVGAAHDILKHGVNALIVPKYSASALADSVRLLLHSRVRRERLGREAQATAVEYDLKRVYEERVALFESILMRTAQENG